MKTKKTAIFTTFFLFFLLLGLTLCNKKDGELSANLDNDTPSILLGGFRHSECEKNLTESNTQTSNYDLVDEVQIKLTEGNRLVFQHRNAIFNCVPGDISADATMNENQINIVEKSTKNDAKCLCTYTLDYFVAPVEKISYVITIEGYSPFKLTVEDDLDITIKLEKKRTELLVSDFSRSGCENDKETSRSEVEKLPNEIQIKLIDNDTLLFQHRNVFFNCCPGKIYAIANLTEENLISIEEKSTEKACKCNCLYALNYKVSPVKKGNYTVDIKGYETFDINVTAGLDIVIRLKPL